MMPVDVDAAAAVALSWLLTYAIHSTILLALAAIAAWRLADHHAWLDLMWKTALIAPLVTATLHLDSISVPLARHWTLPSVTTAGRAPMPAPAPAVDIAPSAAMPVDRVSSSPAIDRSAATERLIATTDNRVTWRQSIVRSLPAIAALAWLIIAIAAVVRYSARLRRVYRALGSGVAMTSSDLHDTVDGLRPTADRHSPILLTTTPICPVPLALAGRHIVLPDRFFSELDPEQQRAALAHEMAHVVRRDPEWRIALDLLERVLFFQPLNRLARGRLCDAAEFLCDEWAVQQAGSPLAMARCLSTVASWWSPADTLPAGVTAMARSDSAMIRRVTRHPERSTARRAAPAPALARDSRDRGRDRGTARDGHATARDSHRDASRGRGTRAHAC